MVKQTYSHSPLFFCLMPIQAVTCLDGAKLRYDTFFHKKNWQWNIFFRSYIRNPIFLLHILSLCHSTTHPSLFGHHTIGSGVTIKAINVSWSLSWALAEVVERPGVCMDFFPLHNLVRIIVLSFVSVHKLTEHLGAISDHSMTRRRVHCLKKESCGLSFNSGVYCWTARLELSK